MPQLDLFYFFGEGFITLAIFYSFIYMYLFWYSKYNFEVWVNHYSYTYYFEKLFLVVLFNISFLSVKTFTLVNHSLLSNLYYYNILKTI
jgi:hypothetical protein